jgi:hypothetical protein
MDALTNPLAELHIANGVLALTPRAKAAALSRRACRNLPVENPLHDGRHSPGPTRSAWRTKAGNRISNHTNAKCATDGT